MKQTTISAMKAFSFKMVSFISFTITLAKKMFCTKSTSNKANKPKTPINQNTNPPSFLANPDSMMIDSPLLDDKNNQSISINLNNVSTNMGLMNNINNYSNKMMANMNKSKTYFNNPSNKSDKSTNPSDNDKMDIDTDINTNNKNENTGKEDPAAKKDNKNDNFLLTSLTSEEKGKIPDFLDTNYDNFLSNNTKKSEEPKFLGELPPPEKETEISVIHGDLNDDNFLDDPIFALEKENVAFQTNSSFASYKSSEIQTRQFMKYHKRKTFQSCKKLIQCMI